MDISTYLNYYIIIVGLLVLALILIVKLEFKYKKEILVIQREIAKINCVIECKKQHMSQEDIIKFVKRLDQDDKL